jgi:hypothetical protein
VKRRAFIVLLIAILGLVALAFWQHLRITRVREELFAEFAPVALSNCELKRFGDANEGGYLLCGNLLSEVRAAYSYGIDGTDNWGCQVAKELGVTTHQYDCFNTAIPPCNNSATRFNAECVGPEPATIDGRPFDTVANQVARNNDTGKHLVVKMDVEGSEWTSLLTASDTLLNTIDQIAVEFHEVEDPAFVNTVRRLKQLFHVAHRHQNNFGCEPGLDPFTGGYVEVLFVSKRLGQVASGVTVTLPHPLDAPNAPWLPDCQQLPADPPSEFSLFRRWLRRAVRAQFPSLGI